jgi:hypothetical protein
MQVIRMNHRNIKKIKQNLKSKKFMHKFEKKTS